MGAAGIVLVLLLGAFAVDQSQNDKIAKGVSIGGVDVSGLTRGEATTKINSEIQETVQQPLKLSYDGKTRTLKPAKSLVKVDVSGMVSDAVERSNSGLFVTNAAKTVAGSNRGILIPTNITYSKRGVDRFVYSARKSYRRDPVDASIHYSAKSIGEVDSRPGLSVKAKQLKSEIISRLQHPTESRRIKVPVRETQAKVTRDQLASKYGTIILVDREGFKLRLFKKLKLFKTYGIAVGQAGLETPAGLYNINDKQTNPSWHVPNSAWAGDLAGKTIPPGPDNPIQARWLGIYDGVGIHGTTDPGSIGSAASHGCIRMIPAQVIDLYDRVPMGTPVYIG